MHCDSNTFYNPKNSKDFLHLNELNEKNPAKQDCAYRGLSLAEAPYRNLAPARRSHDDCTEVLLGAATQLVRFCVSPKYYLSRSFPPLPAVEKP